MSLGYLALLAPACLIGCAVCYRRQLQQQEEARARAAAQRALAGPGAQNMATEQTRLVTYSSGSDDDGCFACLIACCCCGGCR